MRSGSRLARFFAALHLAFVSALVFAELGGFIERIVPPFTLSPAAEPVAQASPDSVGAASWPASVANRPELAPVPLARPSEPGRWHPLDGVKFVPESRQGKTVGLRLSGLAGEGLFAKLGLRDGDRLDSVGGYRVTNPSELLALYTRLRALDALKLLIERDGQPMTITIHLR